MLRAALKLSVRAYQKTLSPFLGSCCRFHPSCSQYALMQLDKNDSLALALYFIAKRLLRCQPLCKGGFDWPKVLPRKSAKIGQRMRFSCQKSALKARLPSYLYLPSGKLYICMKPKDFEC